METKKSSMIPGLIGNESRKVLNNSENTKYQNFWDAVQAKFRREKEKKKDLNEFGVQLKL